MIRSYPTSIPGITTLLPDHKLDDRGWFTEAFSVNDPFYARTFASGIQQLSISASRAGVVRGLHFQRGMAKVMFVISGMARIVNVDIRPNSPTYKQYVSIDVTADMSMGIMAPDWCARGFVAIEPNTQILYLHTATHDQGRAYTINPLDPELKIDWGLPKHVTPIMSEKDAQGSSLIDVVSPLAWLRHG